MPAAPRILVTGAAGFVGARFVESLNRRGTAVVSVDERAAFQQRAEHRGLDFGHVVGIADSLRELESGTLRPTAIVHLGAITDTTELDERLLRERNVEYSQRLWQWATDRCVPFVYASSAATYGAGELGYDDDEARMAELRPLNPYGESKLRFDLWALAQERDGRAPVAWSGFKFFNVYGFGERHKGRMASVVLQAFDQIRERGTVRLFRSHKEGIADGHQARDFVLVDDVVDVLHCALGQPIPRGIYNLGTGRARTFLDLVRAVFAAMGRPESVEFIDTPADIRERYQYFTEARIDRLRAQGYRAPFTSLEDGVRRTVARLAAAESTAPTPRPG
jgi:ADP-L-glycero-D-manno-heptose 6-epimerase